MFSSVIVTMQMFARRNPRTSENSLYVSLGNTWNIININTNLKYHTRFYLKVSWLYLHPPVPINITICNNNINNYIISNQAYFSSVPTLITSISFQKLYQLLNINISYYTYQCFQTPRYPLVLSRCRPSLFASSPI